MKVSIVTVYDSINCGSFLQAYALGFVLKKMGCDVVYYERDKTGGASSSWKQRVRMTIRLLVKHGRSASYIYIKSVKELSRMQRRFPVSNCKSEIDCFVLGSDTIWNLDSDYFNLHAHTYWGIDFFPKKVISYAASAANTKKEKITSELYDAIGNLYAVSVRDEHTYELIKNATPNKIEMVCDPTLLLTPKDYLCFQKPISQKGVVYLYLFKPLTKIQASELKRFCSERMLSIVDGVSFYKPYYSDETSIVEPKTFISYMINADYVITDTFHGVVFSSLFNKKFVAMNRGKNKVKEYLKSVELEDRLINDEENIVQELVSEIDYGITNKKIELLRKHSLGFLKKNVIGDQL